MWISACSSQAGHGDQPPGGFSGRGRVWPTWRRRAAENGGCAVGLKLAGRIAPRKPTNPSRPRLSTVHVPYLYSGALTNTPQPQTAVHRTLKHYGSVPNISSICCRVQRHSRNTACLPPARGGTESSPLCYKVPLSVIVNVSEAQCN